MLLRKKNPTHFFWQLILPVVSAFSSFAQSAVNESNQLNYVDILPPTPAAASLSTFSRAGSGLVTGTAQFNIPICDLSVQGFKVPVSLNYNSNGVKVDEISSRVGINWQLSAGGAITRVVQGAADEYATFLTIPSNTSVTSRPFLDFLRKIDNNRATAPYDAQPDIFQFEFCGYSGKFIIDSLKKARLFPKSNLRIETNFSSSDYNFLITDPNGNKFYFGGTGYKETSRKEQTCAKTYDFFVPSAWFLKKIELNNGEKIDFSYNPVSYEYDLGINQSIYYKVPQSANPGCACPVFPDNFCVNYIKTNTYYLSSVSTKDKIASFIYTSRQDCGDVLLQQVNISSKTDGKLKQSFQFAYDQVYTNLFINPQVTISGNRNKYRPFLKSVRQVGIPSGYTDMYTFSYLQPEALPARLSFAQDHWGYFNGKNNSTLIPPPEDDNLAIQFPTATADRDADTTLTAKGMLCRIGYPTGGSDSIIYEANNVYRENIPVIPDDVITVSNNVTGTGYSTVVEKNLGNFTISFAQKIIIKLRGANATGGVPDPVHHNGVLQIINFSNNQLVYQAGVVTGNITETIRLLPAGTYKVVIRASGAITRTELELSYIIGPMT